HSLQAAPLKIKISHGWVEPTTITLSETTFHSKHPRLLVFRVSEGKIVFNKYDVGSMTSSRASEHRTCDPWVGSFEDFRGWSTKRHFLLSLTVLGTN
ncbi:hypothetical protein WDU94_010365, partial [Cyamophila willieti]